jgi:hypothetical protein
MEPGQVLGPSDPKPPEPARAALDEARAECAAERTAEAKRRGRDVARHNLLAAANAVKAPST